MAVPPSRLRVGGEGDNGQNYRSIGTFYDKRQGFSECGRRNRTDSAARLRESGTGDPRGSVPARRWFDRVDDGSIGLWSELYVVGPDHDGTFFGNVEGVGLSRVGEPVPMEEHERRLGRAGTATGPEDAEEPVAADDGTGE